MQCTASPPISHFTPSLTILSLLLIMHREEGFHFCAPYHQGHGRTGDGGTALQLLCAHPRLSQSTNSGPTEEEEMSCSAMEPSANGISRNSHSREAGAREPRPAPGAVQPLPGHRGDCPNTCHSPPGCLSSQSNPHHSLTRGSLRTSIAEPSPQLIAEQSAGTVK